MIFVPLEPSVQFAVERLLNTVPEGLLIALFAWATLRLLPRQNSRARFAVWFSALATVALLPVFEGLTKTFSFQSAVSELSNGSTGVLSYLGEPAAHRAALTLPAEWAFAVLIVWATIALVLLARIIVGIWNLRALRKTCVEVNPASLDPSFALLLSELRTDQGLASRTITLATSDEVRVPTALGLWTPMVVLPAWALRELPPDDLAIVLRHEFAHLTRWDDWTNLFQKLVRALFFFHPAVWWMERRLSLEREMACDDVVLAQTANPTGYASCLVSLLERSLTQRGWTMAQALVHRAREASERLKQILDTDRPNSTRTAKPALGLIGSFALLCLVILPQSPQVVAFEQTPQPNIAARNYVALTTPSPLNTSLTRSKPRSLSHTETSHTETLPNRGRAALQGRVSETSSKGALAPVVPSDGQSRGPIAGSAALAQNANQDASTPVGTPQTPAPTLVNLIDDTQPTLVFVNATQEVDPESGAVVWRIQVWRLTLTNPMWRHALIPPAHST